MIIYLTLTRKVKYKAAQNLTKKTVETLLNELFVLDNQGENEQKMLEYADGIGMTIK